MSTLVPEVYFITTQQNLKKTVISNIQSTLTHVNVHGYEFQYINYSTNYQCSSISRKTSMSIDKPIQPFIRMYRKAY